MKIKVLFLFIFWSIIGEAQQFYYVSGSGDDINGNGTLGNPYKTVEKAASVAETFIVGNPNTPVTIYMRGGLYRNATFTTNTILPLTAYDPQNIGEIIWKTVDSNVVKLNNVNGAPNAWITIMPYASESVVLEGDTDIAVSIRNCTYIKIQGIEIKGVADKIPVDLAWKYWGTYRYDNAGSWVYGDRKIEICTQYGLSNSSDIPPNIFTTGTTYSNLPDISALNVQRPFIFGGKGILVNLSNNIEISSCKVHDFPGGGVRVTGSDYVRVLNNQIYRNSSRASVGTHGLVIEGLSPDSGTNSSVQKCYIANNLVYSNFNELYSWVQTKTICTTGIDEGKGIALLRTGSINGFNGIIRVENNICYDNGKSGIHTNDVDDAEIYHNTIYNNAHTNVFNPTLSSGTNAGISIQASNTIKISNNIVTVPNGLTPTVIGLSEGQNCTGEVVSHNLVFGGGTNDFPGGFTISDPQFVDVANHDVHLKVTSPAIGAALSSVSPVNDFFGITRDANPDIGAVEYQAPLNVAAFDLSKSDIKLFPNPVSNMLFVQTLNPVKSITLYNGLGQEMQLWNTEEFQTSINVSNLPSGVYFLKADGYEAVTFLKE